MNVHNTQATENGAPRHGGLQTNKKPKQKQKQKTKRKKSNQPTPPTNDSNDSNPNALGDGHLVLVAKVDEADAGSGYTTHLTHAALNTPTVPRSACPVVIHGTQHLAVLDVDGHAIQAVCVAHVRHGSHDRGKLPGTRRLVRDEARAVHNVCDRDGVRRAHRLGRRTGLGLLIALPHTHTSRLGRGFRCQQVIAVPGQHTQGTQGTRGRKGRAQDRHGIPRQTIGSGWWWHIGGEGHKS